MLALSCCPHSEKLSNRDVVGVRSDALAVGCCTSPSSILLEESLKDIPLQVQGFINRDSARPYGESRPCVRRAASNDEAWSDGFAAAWKARRPPAASPRALIRYKGDAYLDRQRTGPHGKIAQRVVRAQS